MNNKHIPLGPIGRSVLASMHGDSRPLVTELAKFLAGMAVAMLIWASILLLFGCAPAAADCPRDAAGRCRVVMTAAEPTGDRA